MAICDYNKKFKKDFRNEMFEVRNASGEEKLSRALQFLRSVKQSAKDSGYDDVTEYLEEWSTFINKQLENIGVAQISALTLQNIISNPEVGTTDVKVNANTTESLDVTVTTKKEFRSDFLEKIYDGADYARHQAVNQAQFNFCSAMLFDRDNGRITKTKKELNNNIREYQQKLMDIVYNYLKTYYNKSRNKIADVDYSIYQEESLKMYEDGKYTGVFEKIFPTASTFFNTFNGRRINNEYFYKTDALQAFNAFQTLLHFDEFLLNAFGDDIKIANMNERFSNTDKYELAAKATNMAWNNQTDDDIDLSKSINNVSKLLITSTRMYDWNGNLIPDHFVQFGQFINVITKLKDIAWDQKLARSIKFNEKKNRKYVMDLSSLSQGTQDFIRGLGEHATLATLINKTGFFPVESMSALFELLTNTETRKLFPDVIKKFNQVEKYVLMSLGKELFNNTGNSLRVIQDVEGYTKGGNYLNYIAQTVEGTWSVRNCQLSQDFETGFTQLVGLSSSSVTTTQRIISDTISNLNHHTTSILDKTYKAGYNKSRGFNLMIPIGGTTHEVRITNKGEMLLDGKDFTLFGQELLPFIDEVLHQNFANNPQHLENYIMLSGKGKKQAIQELFKFAVEVVHGQYTSRKIKEAWDTRTNENASKEDFYLEEAIKYLPETRYGKPRINFDYGTIDIIPQKMLNVLETLAEATILLNTSSASTQVNDSQGKALGTSTPSRLLSTFQRQHEEQRINPNAPAHDFMIISDPNTLLDVQTVREFKTSTGDAKTYNQFNTREFLESSLMHDFITPLISDAESFGKYSLLNNNTIAVTPSVNSDKNTISKMIINLNTTLSKMGYNSVSEFLTDNSSDKLVDLINNELKTYYNKLYKKIAKDLLALSESQTFKSVLGEDFKLKYTPESFKEFGTRLQQYNLANPGQFTARSLINLASIETGIKVNEQLHMIFGKNNAILINNSILALYHRYNDNTKELVKRNMPDAKTFWKYKAVELIESLVKNKVTIDVSNNKQLYKYLTENGLGDWISSSGRLVFAKINGNNVSSEVDFPRSINQLTDIIQMNPLLEKYNMLNYLYSQEFILSTVGTHLNHPNKKAGETYKTAEDYFADEAARYQAQHKRNVSFTASMHPFLLNQFDGIPTDYNISIIQDINDYVYTVSGKTETIKPFDGATFVNPFIVYLENNSLNGEKAGIHKKQFVHFYDEELGTGGIIKTAGFGITNSWMRNSPFMERMMRNMTDIPWKNELGLPVLLDVTKKIQEGKDDDPNNSLQFNNIFFTRVVDGKLQYFKVLNTKYLGEGKYQQEITQVNEYGKEIGLPFPENIEETINSNYKLWKYLFKGLDSVGFNSEGKLSNKGYAGENSIANVVEVINQCGFLKSGDKPRNQENYYQPAKHSDTHYNVTEGAIKQGAANFNEKSKYYEIGAYNRYKIKMLQAGIQLDKEHHADDSEISMMTQVVSACAALGYTWNEANKLYKALYQLTLQGIEPLAKPLAELFSNHSPQTQAEFTKVLAGMFVKSLSNGSKSKDGLIYDIASELIDKYRDGGTITLQDIERNPIPISDPLLFEKVQSMLSSMLTSDSIKLKFKGILSVLVPSHETVKLYGGKLKSDFTNFDKEILELQEQQPMLSASQLEMGRTYIVYDLDGNVVEKVHLQSPTVGKDVYGDPSLKYVGYYDIRQKYSNNYTFQEDITNGRNLAAYFCTFQDEDGEQYNFYDLTESYNLYHGDESSATRKRLQEQLKDLSEGKDVYVTINGITKKVTPYDIKIKPYEVIMPKTMAAQLGLTAEDSLDSLLNDKEAFTKKLVKNIGNGIADESAFTLVLKRINGKHIYVLSRDQFEKQHPNLVPKTSYPPKVDPVDGTVYAVDDEGNNLYKMASNKDQIYTIDGKEVVVTDNLDFYVDNIQYSTLYVSKSATNSVFNSLIKNPSTNRGLKSWKSAVTHNNENDYDIKNARHRNNLLGNVKYENGKFVSNGIVLEGQSLQVIESLGKELYTSFKKSLDIIAARIPAQSMQSFMPMKVVGYEDFDINTAYVSTHQIFLQGSDFDIDCVSLLTFELGRDGKFVGWSPYFNLSSEELLEVSTEFSYPTGESVKYLSYKDVFNVTNVEQLQSEIRDYVLQLFRPFSLIQANSGVQLRLTDPDNADYFRLFVEVINNVSENGLLNIKTSGNVLRSQIAQALGELMGKSISEEELLQAFDSLASMVNNHNLCAKRSESVEAFTKNYVVEQMFRVAKNPSNLIQAQTSVDETTGEPKDLADKYSQAGALLKKATPGNIANLFQSIEDNHVGKDVIGISAVGLKSFFALTQFANTVLRQGDQEQLRRLFSHPITFGYTTDENGNQIPAEYYTIANATTKDLQLNKEILDVLNRCNERDAALMISALLSLATDNAKELCLAKLNANAKMASMYIYGLSIGIPFEQLGKLLMSDIGNTVASLLKGSLITDELKLNNIDSVLKYLDNPVSKVKTIYGSKKLWEQSTGKLSNKSVWRALSDELKGSSGNSINYYNMLEGDTIKGWKLDYGKQGYLATFLEYAAEKKTPSAEIVITLKSLKRAIETVKTEHIPQNKYFKLQALDALISAYMAKAQIEALQSQYKLDEFGKVIQDENGIPVPNENYLWDTAFDDFKTLHRGADELKTLGTFLGANQGVKNKYADYLNFVKKFESCIADRYAAYVEENGSIEGFETEMDFAKFMNDPEYRAKKIEDYDSIKCTFNILEVLTTVPHYWGYLQTVYTKHGALMQESARYRTTHHYLGDLQGAMNMDRKIKALDALVEYKSIMNYFNSVDAHFYLPKGGQMVHLSSTSETKRIPVPTTTKVYLGTQGGDATFKLWVEQEVIPMLKQGFTSKEGGIKKLQIANNGFVKSLRPNTFTKNPHKNSSISYTTSINMSPKAEEDVLALQRLIQEFDYLTTSYDVIDENGVKHSIPIKEIFYIYNLIAYRGKQGQGSLTRIFDNYAKIGGEAFRRSVKEFDLSGQRYEISPEELIAWTSSVESPYSSYSSYIYYKNKKELSVDLLERSTQTDENTSDEKEVRIGQYVVNGSLKNIDTNLVLHRPTHTDIQNITTTIGGQVWEAVYDPVTRKFTKLQSADGTKLNNLEAVQQLLVKYEPTIGQYVLDEQNLTNLIEYQINCQ